jgi:hypothetical protein
LIHWFKKIVIDETYLNESKLIRDGSGKMIESCVPHLRYFKRISPPNLCCDEGFASELISFQVFVLKNDWHKGKKKERVLFELLSLNK